MACRFVHRRMNPIAISGLVESASLPDPKGLLEGKGKRHRHISFETMADLKRSGVKPLLKACHAAWKERSVERKARAR